MVMLVLLPLRLHSGSKQLSGTCLAQAEEGACWTWQWLELSNT